MNTPVELSIAKLLKEKLFDEPCRLCVSDDDERPLPFDCGNTQHKNSIHPYYSSPTIAEVVMWLYEKHGIWISVICDCGNDNLFYSKIFSTEVGVERCIWTIKDISTPTEAYESAILHCLKELT